MKTTKLIPRVPSLAPIPEETKFNPKVAARIEARIKSRQEQGIVTPKTRRSLSDMSDPFDNQRINKIKKSPTILNLSTLAV